MLTRFETPDLPLQRTETCQTLEVPLIRCKNGYADAACAGGNQRIVCKAASADLFIAELLPHLGKNLACARPVGEIRRKDAAGSFKVPFQPFQNAMVSGIRARVEFLQNDRTEPEGAFPGPPLKQQGCAAFT